MRDCPTCFLKRPKPVSDPARSDHARSDPARQVRLGNKKRSRPSGASWEQEGAFWDQEGAALKVKKSNSYRLVIFVSSHVVPGYCELELCGLYSQRF